MLWNVSPDLYGQDTFFTSATDASYKMDPPDKDSKKSEQTTSCDVTSCPPQIILNAIYPGQERLSTPPPTPPVQNKSLLQVVDYRRHIRSSSDPTQIGATRTGRAPSPLVVDNTTPNKTKTEMEDTEFTEFAKLRSKCRSSSAGVNDYSDSILDQYSDCPNIWGDFQKSCPQIYWRVEAQALKAFLIFALFRNANYLMLSTRWLICRLWLSSAKKEKKSLIIRRRKIANITLLWTIFQLCTWGMQED